MKTKINHIIYILKENRKLNQQGFFFKRQVSCVNGFITENARKHSGIYRLKKVALVHFLNQN